MGVNVNAGTVFVVMASSEATSVSNSAIASMTFNINGIGTSALTWVPEFVDVNEDTPALTNGSVKIGAYYGDLTGDGNVSAADASVVLQYALRMIYSIDVNRADVSGNGKITAYDAALILYHVVNPTYVFPAAGGALLKPSYSEPLTWTRVDGAWELRTSVAGPIGADLTLRVTDGTDISSPSVFRSVRDGDVVRIVIASAESENVLIRVTSESAPTVVSAELNEQRVAVLQPVEFALSQNTPNPFNPATTIRFSVPHGGQVQLAVYDVSGRLVRMLVNGTTNAGIHEVIWDGLDNSGREVASGVYMYRIHTGEDVAVRRMLLVR